MRSPASSLLFYFLIASSGLVRADVTLAPLFGDHAILQRGKPIPIWGRANAGEKITITFLDQQVRTTTDADGRWAVYLEAIDARTEGADLVVAGSNTLALHDIIIGEVWLCLSATGRDAPSQNDRVSSGIAADLPRSLVRQIKIEAIAADRPADFAHSGGWQSIGDPANSEIPSMGYFFARDIFQKLGIPVGIICTSAGSAPADAWLSPAAMAHDPLAAEVGIRRKQRTVSEAGDRPSADTSKDLAATSLFNGTINPLLPYAIRGVIWQEASHPTDSAEDYGVAFPAVIMAWRAHFAQGDFPFYWVQLPSSSDGNRDRTEGIAAYREAQSQALALPDTAQVITIDLDSEAAGPDAAVSQAIGRRLALVAKNRVYGIVSDDTGPGFIDATREGTAMRVRLSHASSGLVAHERPVQSLELAGADKIFRPATARIQRESLLVSSPEVRAPVAVRYAWRNAPEANLYNGAGLPAAPFRSDNW